MRITITLALLCAGAGYVWFSIFSQFREYDDEGYMMLAVRHMLDGRAIYDQVPNPYGPAYYLYKWIIHGLLHVPLGNDTTRIGTFVLWIATAGLLAWVVYRVASCQLPVASDGGSQLATGNWQLPWALAGLCFAMSILQLHVLVGEPGHPQEVAAALVALGLLAGWHAGRAEKSGGVFLLGLIGGALLLLKVNVGALLLVSAGLAIVIECPSGVLWGALRTIFGAGAILLPAVLLRRHLSMRWAQQFCALATIGIGLCILVSMRQRLAARRPGRALLLWAAGGAIAAGIPIAFILLRGSTASGMIDCLLLRAVRFPDAFCFPIPMSAAQLYSAAVGVALAVVYVFGRGRLATVLESGVVPAMKAVLALLILVQCVAWSIRPTNVRTWPYDFAITFLWMTLAARPQASMQEMFFRRLLAFVAALQILQMYPVPGSQVGIGTAAIPVIAVLWLGDVIGQLRVRFASIFERSAMHWAGCAPAAVSLGLLAWLGYVQFRVYRQSDRVQLPGCRLTRMTEMQAALYRSVNDNVHAFGQTFVGNTGLNSLYFWAKCRPASTVMIGDAWDYLSDKEQEQLLADNRGQSGLLFIHRMWIFPPPKSDPPLFAYVRSEFYPIGQVGPFTISARGEHPEWRLRSCVRAPLAAGRAKPIELEVLLTKETQPRRLRCQLLEVSLPPGLKGQVSAIELIDLRRNKTIAKTGFPRADKLLVLIDRKQKILLSGMAGAKAAVAIPADPEAWQLAISPEIELERYGAPVARLYKGRTRLISLPIAIPATHADGSR